MRGLRLINCNAPRWLACVAAIILSVQLTACSPAARFERAAQSVDLIREDITVNNLPLVIFRDEIAANSSSIHFYIDGDGSPWIGGKKVATDPTTRSKLILELMRADKQAKILIGRPCYYLSARQRPSVCSNALWTSDRYSEQVVQAMRTLIAQQINRYAPKRVTLIGYSGGGTLATLIANDLTAVDVLVTIAANLDVDAWIKQHGYSPLSRSINAGNFPRLPSKIKQFHFVGESDQNVPSAITKSVAVNQVNARVIEVPGYSHECCWPKTWASALAELVD